MNNNTKTKGSKQAKTGSILEFALEEAAKGHPVVPCGKHKDPWIKNHPTEASTDPDTIKRWFTGEYRAAEAYGVYHYAIDIDGPSEFAFLTLKYPEILQTRIIASTTPGNVQVLFLPPTCGTKLPTKNKHNFGLEHVDVRGGYKYICMGEGSWAFNKEEPAQYRQYVVMPEYDVDPIPVPESLITDWVACGPIEETKTHTNHTGLPQSVISKLEKESQFLMDESACLDPNCCKPSGNRHCINPNHSDSNPSMAINVKNGKLLVTCYAGCDQNTLFNIAQRKLNYSDRGKAVSLREMSNNKTATTWLVENLIPLGAKTLIYAIGGHGKTWWGHGLAAAVSSGNPFLGKYPVTQSGPVLIIDEDSPTENLEERIPLVFNSRNGGDWDHVHVRSMSSLKLTRERDLGILAADIQDIKPALIIWETLSKLMTDYQDENHAKDIVAFFDGIDYLMKVHPFTSLITHHENWLGGLRGSTAIRAGVDMLYHISAWDEPQGEFLVMAEPKRYVPDPPFIYKVGDTKGWMVSHLQDLPKEFRGKDVDKQFLLQYKRIVDGVKERQHGAGVKEIQNEITNHLVGINKLREILGMALIRGDLKMGVGNSRFKYFSSDTDLSPS